MQFVQRIRQIAKLPTARAAVRAHQHNALDGLRRDFQRPDRNQRAKFTEAAVQHTDGFFRRGRKARNRSGDRRGVAWCADRSGALAKRYRWFAAPFHRDGALSGIERGRTENRDDPAATVTEITDVKRCITGACVYGDCHAALQRTARRHHPVKRRPCGVGGCNAAIDATDIHHQCAVECARHEPALRQRRENGAIRHAERVVIERCLRRRRQHRQQHGRAIRRRDFAGVRSFRGRGNGAVRRFDNRRCMRGTREVRILTAAKEPDRHRGADSDTSYRSHSVEDVQYRREQTVSPRQNCGDSDQQDERQPSDRALPDAALPHFAFLSALDHAQFARGHSSRVAICPHGVCRFQRASDRWVDGEPEDCSANANGIAIGESRDFFHFGAVQQHYRAQLGMEPDLVTIALQPGMDFRDFRFLKEDGAAGLPTDGRCILPERVHTIAPGIAEPAGAGTRNGRRRFRFKPEFVGAHRDDVARLEPMRIAGQEFAVDPHFCLRRGSADGRRTNAAIAHDECVETKEVRFADSPGRFDAASDGQDAQAERSSLVAEDEMGHLNAEGTSWVACALYPANTILRRER